MKKHKEIRLPRISADNIAKQLRKALGLDKARQIAEYYNKTVGFHPKTNDPLIRVDDVDSTFITRKEIIKNAHVWRQVSAILANQKGYTLFELVFVLAIVSIAVGALVVGVAEIGVIVHFIRKFW